MLLIITPHVVYSTTSLSMFPSISDLRLGKTGPVQNFRGRIDCLARASGTGLPTSGAFTTTTVGVKIFAGVPSVPTTGG